MFIEIYADLVCPWCYIGKRRLEQALELRPGLSVDIRWMPFQLNPELPEAGMDRATYLVAKFGSIDRARQLSAMVEQAASKEGLPLRLDLVRRTPNTTNAHRLVRFAERFGRSTEMASTLFQSYFAQGLDIGATSILLELAIANGLPGDEVATYLSSEADKAAIRAGDQQARQLGVQAVPCFVFERRYALSGAQEPQAFLPFLDMARG
ncbi:MULTISPECIES: DsbA family oxidoreductase [unclassified Azospirillum]|uniref:DsbA family oxidoreductase n=1 Tax=unclassified Azospirillum TaxID=2630922 RepID=UPI000B70991B|nr:MULTISPECIES: DsbA family oxidoreductase [unclassified Azospirillum]SNS35110.1 Predicted dithiol-disulfide isomerase, DsbA family [Azospirillum sp. RU38E]SNS53490.1 Predicted dithiol-disulfide isomerase, DsbA family [Azospirillum sp. RU37A]